MLIRALNSFIKSKKFIRVGELIKKKVLEIFSDYKKERGYVGKDF